MSIDLNNLVAWRLMGQAQAAQAAKQEQVQRDSDIALKTVQQQEAMKNAEFDRALKTAEFKSKAAREMGMPAPKYTNPNVQEAADIGGLGAGLDQLGRQRTADVETLKNTRDMGKAQYNQNAETDRTGMQMDNALEIAKMHDRAMVEASKNRPNMQLVRMADTDAQKLGKDLDPFAAMKQDVIAMQDIIKNKKLEGHGPLIGRLPDWAISSIPGQSNALEHRQIARRMMSSIIYLTSGKQINEHEADRLLAARGLGDQATPEAWYLGGQELLNEMQRTMKAREAKYRLAHPDLVQQYGDAGGVTSENIMGAPDMQVPPAVTPKRKNPFAD